jgi:hypothetical protein
MSVNNLTYGGSGVAMNHDDHAFALHDHGSEVVLPIMLQPKSVNMGTYESAADR